MYTSKIKKVIPTTKTEITEVTLSLTQYIANKIQQLREERKLNVSDLAKITYTKANGNSIAELSNSTISNIEKYLEKDEKYPSYKLSNLIIIADALEVDFMELLPYKEYYELKNPHVIEKTEEECNQVNGN